MCFEPLPPFSRTWVRHWAVLLLLVWSVLGCSRTKVQGARRSLICSFENLSEDSSLDWTGQAACEILAIQLEDSQRYRPLGFAPHTEASRSAGDEHLYGYWSVVGGRLRISAFLVDARRTRFLANFSAEGRPEQGIVPLLNPIARALDPDARAFGTMNPAVVKKYAEGREARDAAASATAFEDAVRADPGFGPGYVAWARASLARGDAFGAQRAIEQARNRWSKIEATDRLRLDLLAAMASNDPAGEISALTALVRRKPWDTELLRSLALLETQARRYVPALEHYRKAAVLEPSNVVIWNELGYTEAYAHNLEGAVKALSQYQRLAPQDANPLDSLGDVHFYLGRFPEAESFYLQAYAKDAFFLGAATLYKAAWARLMTGDVNGADRIFQQFLEQRRKIKDPLADYREAQWLYLTGHRSDGAAMLKSFIARAGATPAALSVARAQLSLWSFLRGDAEKARHLAAQAMRTATSPDERRLAWVCWFIVQSQTSPDNAPERLLKEFSFSPDDTTKKIALSYACLLGRRYVEAGRLLSELVSATGPSSFVPAEALLAWALVECGRLQDAAQYLETWGIPDPGGASPLLCLAFPRIFYLRSAVLNASGRQAEAERSLRIFKRLSGLDE